MPHYIKLKEISVTVSFLNCIILSFCTWVVFKIVIVFSMQQLKGCRHGRKGTLFISVLTQCHKKFADRDWRNKRHYCVKNYGPCHDVHKGKEIVFQLKSEAKFRNVKKSSFANLEKNWPQLTLAQFDPAQVSFVSAVLLFFTSRSSLSSPKKLLNFKH